MNKRVQFTEIRRYGRKLLPYFIALLLFSLIVFLYRSKQGSKKINDPSSPIAVRYLSKENKGDKKDPRLIDTDGDGVYDWKEELLGLDIHSPDSDNDGVSDLEYVRNLEREADIGAQGKGENLTLSDRFGRGVYTALYLLKKANGGKPLDDETKKKVEENVKNYIENLNFGEKLYTRDSIEVVEDTKENDFAYEKTMKKLFETYPVKLSDFQLLSKSVGKAKEHRVEIANVVMRYDEYLHELEKVKVPQLIVQKHLQLMNGLMKLKTALANLDNEDDGIIVMSALSQFSKLIEDVLDAIVKINTYFEIIHEPGAFS